MTWLRTQIELLRCQVDSGDEKNSRNDEDSFFIPHGQLYKLMTRDIVLDAVKDCSEIPSYNLQDVVAKVLKGGLRVFSILVLVGKESLISSFIESDNLQRSRLDDKLPFSADTLQSIILDTDAASNFYRRQWEFVAPVFSRSTLHRSLNSKMRLPFVQNKKLGEGGFGVIYEIQLHPDHQRLPLLPRDKNIRLVRKELESGDNNHNTELRNLNILNELKHPAIVELLSSYTYKGKHNFIFPLAPDGDLSMLFQKEDRPPQFKSDVTFYHALGKLSSAVEKVHQYASGQLDLHLIGCHHDIKPKNILVHNDIFILADFGLAQFKQPTDSSKTRFRIGEGHYLAPECEDYENFDRGIIGRSSDIWSFGCIISEVLTYMKRGPTGIEEFKRKRKFTFRHFTTYAFHAGKDTSHEGVLTWLVELEKGATRPERMIVRLVRDMLNIEAQGRPSASQITSRLRFTVLDACSQTIDEYYQELDQKIESLELHIEGERFKSWKWAFGLDEDYYDIMTNIMDSELDFELTLKNMFNIRTELESIASRYRDALSPIFLHLRLLNDQLIALLPRELQERARTHLELHIIHTDDSSLLEKTQNLFEGTPTHRRIGMLATIKRLSILASQRSGACRPGLRSDPKLVQCTKAFEDHNLAKIDNRQVLVEWIRYDTWEGSVLEEMFTRVESIAELFNSVTSFGEFRDDFLVLHCSSFFHDPSRFAFGLVYEFPSFFTPEKLRLEPYSLADVLTNTKDTRIRPSLGDRFKLAYKLTATVLEFHKVGWMHKSISAYNVIFFSVEGTKRTDSVQRPHIIGFNHSRPDEVSAFTEGPDRSSRHKEYQHPVYSKSGQRFRPDFDYYSLGIVLLEIGLWRTLDDMTKGSRATTPYELQQYLLERRVPHLHHSMGKGYCEAVSSCLKGGEFGLPLETDCTAETTTALHLSFERRVIEPLSKCSA